MLAYSARGFGESTGQIALDSLDYEVPDARAIVDWLAEQPEVVQDGAGDPRVGVTGGSYGGALSLMLAGTDPRIDAAVPLITWNDLEQSLFPNAQATPADLEAPTPAAASGVEDGVFKKFWASTLMASVTTGASLSASSVAQGDSGDSGFVRRGGTSSSSAAPAPDAAEGTDGTAGTSGIPTGDAAVAALSATCGRMMVELCAGYAQAAQTGRITDTFSALLDRSSPKEVVGNITAPTLIVQGERDTLFPLSQADANARAIAANGATVAMTWFNGGHDGGSPDAATEARITEWFQHYLAGTGPVPVQRVPVHRRRADQRHRIGQEPHPGGPGLSGSRGRIERQPGEHPADRRPAVRGEPARCVAGVDLQPAGPVRPGVDGAVDVCRRTTRPDGQVLLRPVRRADRDHRNPAHRRHGVQAPDSGHRRERRWRSGSR